MPKLLLLLLFCGCSVFAWVGVIEPIESNARKAERLVEEGQFPGAIEAYEAHIAERLADPQRKLTENPYFYYLAIGDLYLKQDQVEEAREAYIIAKEHKVSDLSLIDRFLQLANWHVDREEYEEAIYILLEYREIHPLIFDGRIDEVHKLMVAAEQEETTF